MAGTVEPTIAIEAALRDAKNVGFHRIAKDPRLASHFKGGDFGIGGGPVGTGGTY